MDKREQLKAAREFIRRATELQRGAETMLAEGNLNAAALLAVHAGKSGVDAVTASVHGVISSNGTYMELVRLVGRDRDRREESLAIKLGELLSAPSAFGTGGAWLLRRGPRHPKKDRLTGQGHRLGASLESQETAYSWPK